MKLLRRPDVIVVLLLWLCALPFQDQLSLSFGHPLRMMATVMCVTLMRFFGSGVTNEGTTIHAGAGDIAITDACSGVEELLGLLLAGYLIARYRQKNLGWTFFAWAFAVPAVAVANAVRLVALVLLHGVMGDAVLVGAWHVGFGWAQAALALALMWGAGELVRKVS